uniref:Uncharacterized protein n=2 Tax=Lygus hesperus TaxID=30085 RepID=A0A146M8N0_LYGHE
MAPAHPLLLANCSPLPQLYLGSLFLSVFCGVPPTTVSTGAARVLDPLCAISAVGGVLSTLHRCSVLPRMYHLPSSSYHPASTIAGTSAHLVLVLLACPLAYPTPRLLSEYFPLRRASPTIVRSSHSTPPLHLGCCRSAAVCGRIVAPIASVSTHLPVPDAASLASRVRSLDPHSPVHSNSHSSQTSCLRRTHS